MAANRPHLPCLTARWTTAGPMLEEWDSQVTPAEFPGSLLEIRRKDRLEVGIQVSERAREYHDADKDQQDAGAYVYLPHVLLDLGEIAQDNLKKLYSRKERGTLTGSGDNR